MSKSSARDKVIRDATTQLTRVLTDEGKLIEAGFASLKAMAIHPKAPAEQVEDLRDAFFAGAQHLWGSIMSILEPGKKETPNDLNRMSLIAKELGAFAKAYEAKHMKTKGRA